MIRSKIFIAITIVEVLLLSAFSFFSYPLKPSVLPRDLESQRELVRHLALTDFSIWTEARYTRHPSQTDFFSPFQEFPSAIEHFPAGSIIAPVAGARRPAR